MRYCQKSQKFLKYASFLNTYFASHRKLGPIANVVFHKNERKITIWKNTQGFAGNSAKTRKLLRVTLHHPEYSHKCWWNTKIICKNTLGFQNPGYFPGNPVYSYVIISMVDSSSGNSVILMWTVLYSTLVLIIYRYCNVQYYTYHSVFRVSFLSLCLQ